MLNRAMAIQECKACHEAKPLTEYYRSVTNRDGLVSKCKRCMAQSNQRKVSPYDPCLPCQPKCAASKLQLFDSEPYMTNRLIARNNFQSPMSSPAAAHSIFWCLSAVDMAQQYVNTYIASPEGPHAGHLCVSTRTNLPGSVILACRAVIVDHDFRNETLLALLGVCKSKQCS